MPEQFTREDYVAKLVYAAKRRDAVDGATWAREAYLGGFLTLDEIKKIVLEAKKSGVQEK